MMIDSFISNPVRIVRPYLEANVNRFRHGVLILRDSGTHIVVSNSHHETLNRICEIDNSSSVTFSTITSGSSEEKCERLIPQS